MTACVNKHTKRVAAVVTASLVGALSLGVAPVAAMAAGSVDMLVDPTDVWSGIDFTWNVEADKFGNYTVKMGDQFLLTGATDPFGDPVSMSDLTVVYANGSTDALSKSTPEDAGKHTAYIVDAKIDIADYASGSDLETKLNAANIKFTPVPFTVEAKSLEGAHAYEGDDVSDTTFKFTGKPKEIGFADADGNKLSSTGDKPDYKVTRVVGSSSSVSGITNAGEYLIYLEGLNDYEGSTATVKVTVDQIDLEKDIFTVDVVENDSASYSGGTYQQNSTNHVYVNGEELADNIVKVDSATGWVLNPSTGEWEVLNHGSYGAGWVAKLDLVVSAASTPDSNFVSDTAKGTTKGYVVDKLIRNFYYNNDPVSSGSTITIDTVKGETFDTGLFTAAESLGESSLPVTVTVTKDGEELGADYDLNTPGEYEVRVDVDMPSDLAYGGSATFKVKVLGKHYNVEPEVFAAIDGKDVKTLTSGVEYDGEAVEPLIVAKSGSLTIDPADYTVTYTDEDGNAVEKIVEPGDYTFTVDFGNATYGINGENKDVQSVTYTFTVTKAQLRSAKADKDVYAWTGEAVTPLFTAYNEGDLEGLSLEIDPSVTGVSYFELKVDKKTGKPYEYDSSFPVSGNYIDTDGDGNADYELKNGTALKASDLKDEGYYVAELTAPADDAHFQGQVYSVPFQVSTYAAYSDVAADAWYADAVYNAADLGYMTGISGTDLFMPEASITRAELAKVFANMAGEAFSPIYTPTKFDDVDPLAWYAGAVSWADEAGIVTGYDDTTFGPSDKATREQVAVMLYRYAKGQGKDVTVENADETLSAYKDADQVSDWAKEAMAWAVENGIFGQGTDELWAKQDIQRAAVATIAVRFQPETLPEA